MQCLNGPLCASTSSIYTLGLLPGCLYLSANPMTLKFEGYGYVPSPIIFKSLLS